MGLAMDLPWICSLHLDHHFAGVVPSEESHESLWHLLESLHHCLPHLDLPCLHPAGHGLDSLGPSWASPASHQETLDLQFLEYTERENVLSEGEPSLRVVPRDGATDARPPPRVHGFEHRGADVPSHVIEVTVHTI